MTYLQSYKLCMFLFVAGLAIAWLFNTALWGLILGLVLILGGFVQYLIFFRCPKCHKSLVGFRFVIPEKCRHCGHKL